MRYSPDPSNPSYASVPDVQPEAGQGLVFGAAASAYERGRPSYPREAVEWLAGDATVALDLGAGTGKFTRLLADVVDRVIAVDPDAVMLGELSRVSPAVEALVGSAESIPLPDASVDVVTVAQAWHWVDLDRAVPEVARVLRPGGTLSLVWNVRDDSREWVAQLGEVIHRGASQDLDEVDPIVGSPFGPIERRDFEWVHHTTIDEFRDMVASRSYVIAMSPTEREAVLAEAEAVVLAEPGQSREKIVLPYITHAYRAQL